MKPRGVGASLRLMVEDDAWEEGEWLSEGVARAAGVCERAEGVREEEAVAEGPERER